MGETGEAITALALRAGQGDRAALTRFIASTQADVWRFCAHLGDRDRADDLTQETYVRAVNALPRFRGDASALTWLLSIARRVVADGWRAEERHRRRTRAASGAEVAAAAWASAEAAGGAGELELQLCLRQLDPERQAAFVLTQVLGYSYAEAADLCDCPVGTIRSRVARARQDLIDALSDQEARPGGTH